MEILNFPNKATAIFLSCGDMRDPGLSNTPRLLSVFLFFSFPQYPESHALVEVYDFLELKKFQLLKVIHT